MIYTDEEFKKFDMLTLLASSQSNIERIKARLEIDSFVKIHGKEKCDAMWEKIQEMDKK